MIDSTSTEETGGAPGRVLIVDDEPAIARVVERMLVGRGYSVTTAHDARTAVANARSSSFDAVVSDIQMPDLGGLALLRSIRASDLDVPVIFLTGSPDLQTAMEALEYGAFRYLMKPVARNELLDAVARAVGWHRLALARRDAAREVHGRPIADRAGLETRFASALEGLWMAMQPIVCLSKRTVFAYEALVRTEEVTLRNPLDFLDAAERLDRTVDLGRAIRTRVASAMQDVPGSGNVFVNLHPRDFADPDLVGEDGALTPFAKHIVLEITERSAPDQIPDLGKSIARLRSLGFRLALDDLGAGYAGLSSFAWLEPEVVKVDMSLVRGIDKSVVKQKLFRSIHSLCGDLHADLIAEGIETVAERDCVCFLGADLLQGYLFARPARGFPPVSREPLRHAAPH